MKILLTGVTGYIGKRLLPVLLKDGHEVVCVVRDKKRFNDTAYPSKSLSVIEANFLDPASLEKIPADIDVAYYLIHSMSATVTDFERLERECALNFRDRLNKTNASQVVYLSGIVNEDKLSDHLRSRKGVEEILGSGNYALTTLRAGIIVGSGSASFEIIRDLVEKLPLMVAPKWIMTRSQPIAVSNVIQFLKGVLRMEDAFDKSFDIGGPEILTYKDMLLQYAKIRRLRRTIINVPVMTPRLSSYWLYFVTSTSYKLAVNLVDSMKVEIICRENDLHTKLGIKLLNYREAVTQAFDVIAQQEVLSSWTDALTKHALENGLSKLMTVPEHGCFKDIRRHPVTDVEQTKQKIWAIGGENGWYYANWLWNLRGFLDKMAGGVGLRRGRKNKDDINAGESLDFWRVLYASREEQRLLLYAEMKLPGEAWLEFAIHDNMLTQTATFRPRGLWGRMYWFMVLPFHHIIFKGMVKRIAQ
ncbi:MAG: SDR family oxidoreductase [Bacteroidales bacterium]|jgi:uncharacterized protein YbjT (DUF2867 family)|nr:SDR family oxidoreductase [Bacteroidales bacterium]